MAMQSIWLRPTERDNFERLREIFASEAKAIGFNCTVFNLVDEKKANIVVEGITPVGLTILLNKVRQNVTPR